MWKTFRKESTKKSHFRDCDFYLYLPCGRYLFANIFSLDGLFDMVEDRKDEWEDEFETILKEFEAKTGRKVLHTLLFY